MLYFKWNYVILLSSFCINDVIYVLLYIFLLIDVNEILSLCHANGTILVISPLSPLEWTHISCAGKTCLNRIQMRIPPIQYESFSPGLESSPKPLPCTQYILSYSMWRLMSTNPSTRSKNRSRIGPNLRLVFGDYVHRIKFESGPTNPSISTTVLIRSPLVQWLLLARWLYFSIVKGETL